MSTHELLFLWLFANSLASGSFIRRPTFDRCFRPVSTLAVTPQQRCYAIVLQEADNDEDSLDDARRFLGLGGGDRDVERLLRAGTTLLGCQITVVLPPNNLALEEALLSVTSKAVKLGGSVMVLSEQTNKKRLAEISKGAPYPRCTLRYGTNFSSAEDMTRALRGSSALILSAAQLDAHLQALQEALHTLEKEAQRYAASGLNAAAREVSEPPATASTTSTASITSTAASASAATPMAADAFEAAARGLEQLVLVSSVEARPRQSNA